MSEGFSFEEASAFPTEAADASDGFSFEEAIGTPAEKPKQSGGLINMFRGEISKIGSADNDEYAPQNRTDDGMTDLARDTGRIKSGLPSSEVLKDLASDTKVDANEADKPDLLSLPSKHFAVTRGFVSTLLKSNPEMVAATLDGFSYLTPKNIDAEPSLAGLTESSRKMQDMAPDTNSTAEVLRWASKKVADVAKLSPEEYAPRAKDSADFDNVLTWIGEATGQATGSTVPSVAGGVAGAAVGGAPGAVAGAAAPSFMLNYGDVYQSLVYAGVPKEKAASAALGAAIPITALDIVPAERFAGRISGAMGINGIKEEIKKRTIAGLLKEVGKDALIEGGTEGAQQVIQDATVSATAKDKPFFTWETAKDVGLNAIAGVLGGTVLGGATSTVSHVSQDMADERKKTGLINQQTQNKVDDYIINRDRQYAGVPAEKPRATISDILSAGTVDDAIAMAQEAAKGSATTSEILAGADMLDEDQKAGQQGKLNELFKGLNAGTVEQAPDGSYLYRMDGEKPVDIPLRVWDENAVPAPGSPMPNDEDTIPRELAQVQREHYGNMGIDVVYFENDANVPFDGAVDPTQPNTIFLSNNPDRNAAQVAAHEVTHVFEDTQMPDGVSLADIMVQQAKLQQQVKSGLTATGKNYAEDMFGGTAPKRSSFGEGEQGDAEYAQATAKHFISEITADIGGEAPKFATFMPRVLNEVENRYGASVAKDVLRKIMDGIRSAMETLRKFFGGSPETASQDWVTNLDEIHDTLAKIQAIRFGSAVERENAKLADQRDASARDRMAKGLPEGMLEDIPAIPSTAATAPVTTAPVDEAATPAAGEVDEPGQHLGPEYATARKRASTLRRWLGELDAKRREDAISHPETKALQQAEAEILRKVGGREERLTGAARERLSTIRAAIEGRLNPKTDNEDMARVRAAMVKEHKKLADLTSVSKVIKQSPRRGDDTMRLRIKPTGDMAAAKQAVSEIQSGPGVFAHPFATGHYTMNDGTSANRFAMLKLSAHDPKTISIDWISTVPPRSGVGTVVMKRLQEEAAAKGMGLTLSAWEKGGIAKNKLIAIYKKMGFVQDSKGSSDMTWRAGQQLEAKEAPKAATKKAQEYPVADRSEWYGNADYKARGGKITKMSPDEFLKAVRPLDIDEASRDNIDDLKRHIASGKKLDPLTLYADGKEDGRHRAVAAKELGIKSVPVIDFRGAKVAAKFSPKQTETEAFKEWFGDSKVVDADGKPLVVYHGTPNGVFNDFDTMPAFFSENEAAARGYADGRYSRDGNKMRAPVVVAAYLSLQNPKIYTEAELNKILPGDDGTVEWADFDNLAYELEKGGHDGVIVRGTYDYMGGVGAETKRGRYDQFVVFEPTQIKSATGNSGAFDKRNPDIRFSPAYHGSPHKFDRFDSRKIGTGEGFQAFGHGLYFASKKEVGEAYRSMLTKGNQKLRVNGTFPGLAAFKAPREIRAAVRDVMESLSPQINPARLKNSYEYRLIKAKAPLDTDPIVYAGSGKPLTKAEEVAHFERQIKAVEWLENQEISYKGAGRLYHVELAPKENEYLDHDKRFSEQSDLVKGALESAATPETFQKIKDSDLTGENIYREISREQKTIPGLKSVLVDMNPGRSARDAKASAALLKAGVRGIRYLDAFSRGDLEGSHNYVIFDDADVEITNVKFSPRQTQTPEFQRWFGDGAVTNEDGTPRVVYHHTAANENFDAFKRRPGDIGIHFGTIGQADDRADYMRGRAPGKRGEAERTIPVYINIKNPLRVRDIGAWDHENLEYGLRDVGFSKFEIDKVTRNVATPEGKLMAIRKLIEGKGYDGIVYRNTGEVAGANALLREREAAQEALNRAQLARGKKQNGYDFADQQTPEYKAYRDAYAREHAFRQENAEDSYIAFHPNQIKSAIGNSGAFDAKDPRIQFSPKQQDTPEFRKWFGDSRAVDKTGKPQVVYHGTVFDISAFDPLNRNSGRSTGAKIKRPAVYFTASPEEANWYANLGENKKLYDEEVAKAVAAPPVMQNWGGTMIAESPFYTARKNTHVRVEHPNGEVDVTPSGANVMPAYLRMENPLIVDMKGKGGFGQGHIRRALENGNDGVILRNSNSQPSTTLRSDVPISDHYVVFSPEQIKSAIGNAGTFDAGNPDIRFSPRVNDKTKELFKTVPGFKRVAASLEPGEVAPLMRRTAEKLVRLFEDLPSAEETAAVAYSGRAKRGWYKQSAQAIVEVFGTDDGPRFVALLAATSPQTSVESNLENALRTWTNWVKEGRPTEPKKITDILGRSVQGTGGADSVLGAWVNNTIRALTSEDPATLMLSGPKVNSFAANLRNEVNAVTNDAWMATFAAVDANMLAAARRGNTQDAFGDSFGFKSPGYLAMTAMVRDAAKILTRKTGQVWTPAEVQETVWSWAKTLYERRDRAGEDRTAQEILKAADLTHEDINSTPDFATLLIGGLYRKILEGGGYADAVQSLERSKAERGGSTGPSGPAVAVTSAEGSGFAQDAFERHIRRAAGRLERVRTQRLEDAGADPRDLARSARESTMSANMSAATPSIPGLQRLADAANDGDVDAGRLLNSIAQEYIERFVGRIPGVKMEVSSNGGLYGGSLEPSIGLKLQFDEGLRDKVMGGLSRFAAAFNQEQIHVRQPVNERMGRGFTDGSYATPVYTIDLKEPLSRDEIQRVIDASGLYGVTFNDEQITAYYVGDRNDAPAIQEFLDAIDRARDALGENDDGARLSIERLWAYGNGDGSTQPYPAFDGNLPGEEDRTSVPRAIAERLSGREVEPTEEAASVTPEQARFQRRIAEDYEQLPDNDLSNPLVERAYQELVAEVGRQYDALPIKVEIWADRDAGEGGWKHRSGEPYKSSAEMRRDILENNHLWVYGTTPETFGPAGADFSGHPLLEDTGRTSSNGYPMLANDELRAVHDYYAHLMSPVRFGPAGEEAAWRNHIATMENPWARWALTSETRGQNSWVNFGSHVEPGTPLKDRPFARQKAALLPIADTLSGSDAVDLPVLELMRDLSTDEQRGSLPEEDFLAEFSPRVSAATRAKLEARGGAYRDMFQKARPIERTAPAPAPAAQPAAAPVEVIDDFMPPEPTELAPLGRGRRRATSAPAAKPAAQQAPTAAPARQTNQRPAGNQPEPIIEDLPEEPKTRALSIKSVEGAGAERARAVNGALYLVAEEQPQLDKAAALVAKDLDRAIAIAMRQEQSIPNVHPEFVYMAVEQYAKDTGDVALQMRLSNSRIAEEATEMGRRIAAWRNRGEISPVDDMRRIREAREAKAIGSSAGRGLIKDGLAKTREAANATKKTSVNELVLKMLCPT